MSININHSNSGNVTLQTSQEVGSSTFYFPNVDGESTILVSGYAQIDHISGLCECLSIINAGNSFETRSGLCPSSYIGAIQQKTSIPIDANCAIQCYSIALGCNASTNYPYEIAMGLSSNGIGFKQTSQLIFSQETTGDQPCEIFCNYKSSYTCAISYLNGKVIAKGCDKYASFDFCFVYVATGGPSSAQIPFKIINTGLSYNGNYGFTIDLVSHPCGNSYWIDAKVIGQNETNLSWLAYVNDLNLKTN